ncbi:arabinose ABC transporter permease [Maritimibacter sp. 55A14]|uniref:MFS transporter n=1 Tax=Maritimibacter sp. 55A14 TaxID=2174844 RepID=UPI000D6052E3|nr:MFS transporter [Maritimibacter sp. 55A14]PWE30604.1 arabinose ABC transporter permease [Maritimibacter sp. 55A14]
MTNRWSILAVLFFARLTMAFQFQSVAALSPLVAGHYGASLADTGLLIGLYLAPGVALAIPGGAMSARIGDKTLVALGMVLMLAGALAASLTPAWEIVLAGRVLAGTGGVILNVLMTKMVTDWFAGREISTAMGIYVNSWPVGIALALVLLPGIGAPLGLGTAWGAVAALVGLGLAAFLLGYRPPAAAPRPATGMAGVPLPLLAICLAGAIWALYNAALAMVFSFGPALLAARGWPLASAGATTSLVLWLVAVSIPLGGLIADRTGRRDAVLAVGLGGFALLLAGAPFMPDAMVPAGFALMGFLAGLPAGPVMGLPSLVLGPRTRALGMGVFFTLYYAAIMAAPVVAGATADRLGDVRVTFLMGALMLLACLAAQLAFLRRARPAPAAP